MVANRMIKAAFSCICNDAISNAAHLELLSSAEK